MDNEQNGLRQRLEALRQEHSDLDASVDALLHTVAPDMLRIQRLKKRKLQIKDEMRIISAKILPDIIA